MSSRIGNWEVFPAHVNFNFMKWRGVSIGISGVLTVLALAVIAIKGVNYSIDFLGGSQIALFSPDGSIDHARLAQSAKQASGGHTEVTSVSNPPGSAQKGLSYLLLLQRDKGDELDTSTAKAQALVRTLQDELGKDKLVVVSTTHISGKVGKEEEVRGLTALLLACVGILAYVAVRFDSRFAPGAVICLVHNVIIALGAMTLLGRPFSNASIPAFLTIVGYTINDTVIVYDRIRETRLRHPKMPLVDVVNRSINQTLSRTVLTATTALLALIVLILFGGGEIEDFALTMFLGILTGTYSSIYVAAPLTLVMDEWLARLGFARKEKPLRAVSSSGPDYAPPVVLRRKPGKK